MCAMITSMFRRAALTCLAALAVLAVGACNDGLCTQAGCNLGPWVGVIDEGTSAGYLGPGAYDFTIESEGLSLAWSCVIPEEGGASAACDGTFSAWTSLDDGTERILLALVEQTEGRLGIRLYDQIKVDPETVTGPASFTPRGERGGEVAAEGSYEPVAEVLFNELNVDGYFLEYDDVRSGGFEPLRFVPNNKTVVLGLVSTKVSQLEEQPELISRIQDASQYVPLERLCLSPQCGFSSTLHGNEITEDDQWRKLELVVNTAQQVWGS